MRRRTSWMPRRIRCIALRGIVSLMLGSVLASGLTACAASPLGEEAPADGDGTTEVADAADTAADRAVQAQDTADASGTKAVADADAADTAADRAAREGEESTMREVSIDVGGHTFVAALADTPAAREFAARLPMTFDMAELGGNEKYCYTDSSYPTDGSAVVNPIEAGDLMLYEDDCVVLFYGTHDNAVWSYVPLGHIDDPAGLAEAVGTGQVTVTFSAAE